MFCRIGGFALIAAWIVAAFLPASVFAVEGAGLPANQISPDMLAYSRGYEFALGGWLYALPPQPMLAWFATPLGVWCLIAMLRGRAPGLVAALGAAGLAAMLLLPGALDHSIVSRSTDGPAALLAGAYVWASSFAVPIAVLILIHALRLPPEPDQLLKKASLDGPV
jgi:hypothetical protein